MGYNPLAVERLLIYTIASMPISITLHHGLIILLILIAMWEFISTRTLRFGKLFTPINLFNFPLVTSTLIYHAKWLWDSIATAFLNYAYLFPFAKGVRLSHNFMLRVNAILFLEGMLLLIPFFYNYFVLERIKLLWGDVFKPAEIYALFSISALSLGIYRRSAFFFLMAGVYTLPIVMSGRRSEVLGLVLAFLVIMTAVSITNRRYLKHLVASLIVCGLVTLAGSFYLIEVKKDHRFITLVEVITGKRPLDEQALDRISSLRVGNFKAGLEITKRDIEERNVLPLIIGHGAHSGAILDPPPATGGAGYESVILFHEFIERGVLGAVAIALLYAIPLITIFRIDFSKEENALLITFVGFLIFYNFSKLFRPYVDSLFPLALLMFALAETTLRGSQGERR